MAKSLEPIDIGILTPVRRIRNIFLRFDYDQAGNSAIPRVTATFEYDVAYPDATGKEVFPLKHDGFAEMQDEALRGDPDIVNALAALGNAAEDAAEQRNRGRAELASN